MNNGFENDNISGNGQQGDGNDNINSDINDTEAVSGADDPRRADDARSTDSSSARTSNGSGRTKSENTAPAEPDPDGESDIAPKEKFSFKNFKISDMIAPVKKFWTDMTPKKRKMIIAAAIALVAVVVIVAVAVNVNRNPMVTIYTALERTEAMEMAGVLEELGIPAKVDTSIGAVVLNVRQKQEYAAVRELSKLGYPQKAGLIYTEQTTGGLFETEAQIEEKNLRNSENRLGAIIGNIEGIERADVTITPASKVYTIISQAADPTKANVVIYTKPGYTLSYESVMGIEAILLTGVAGLTKENVSVHDSTGALLNVEITEETQFDTLAEFKAAYDRKAAREVEQNLRRIFELTFGIEQVDFMVSIEHDFNPWIREAVKYNGANVDPDTEEQAGILSSEEWERNVFSGTDSSIQGIAGTPLNTDEPDYYELSEQAAEGNFGDNFHTYNQYLVDSVKEQSSKETPNILSCTVTMVVNRDFEDNEEYIDILINAIATGSPVAALAMKNATEDTPVDIETYRNYITVVPMPFYEDAPETPPPPTFNLFEWLIENFNATQLLIGSGILLLFILLIIVIIIIARRLSKKDALAATAATEEIYEEDEDGIVVDSEGKPVILDDFGKAVGKYASAEETVVNPIKPNENKEQLLKKQIKMFTDQNPDITAELIRTLLKGDEITNG